jgi:hypothetical protein
VPGAAVLGLEIGWDVGVLTPHLVGQLGVDFAPGLSVALRLLLLPLLVGLAVAWGEAKVGNDDIVERRDRLAKSERMPQVGIKGDRFPGQIRREAELLAPGRRTHAATTPVTQVDIHPPTP